MNWNHINLTTHTLLYPGGSTNFQFSIGASDDNTIGSNTAYVAKNGNDLTGNGSRRYPFLTIQKGLDSGKTCVVVGSGVYIEALNAYNGNRYLISDTPHGVILEGTGIPLFGSTAAVSLLLIGCIIQNYGQVNSGTNNGFGYSHCMVSNMRSAFNQSTTSSVISRAFRTVFRNITGTNFFHHGADFYTFCTFVNSNVTLFDNSQPYPVNGYHIFDNCAITISAVVKTDFNLFTNCTFSIKGGAFTAHNTLASFKAAYDTQFPNNGQDFKYTKFTDPLFLDKPANNFALSLNSPARNMTFDAKSIGALPISSNFQPQNALYTENITITNGVATQTNPSLPSLIRTPIIDNGGEYEIGTLNFIGDHADRNGIVIDSNTDLSNVTISAGTTIGTNNYYVVEGGSINYNGVMYQVGSRFTAVAASTTFSTTEGGVIREILSAPNKRTIKAKFHRNLGDTNTFNSLAWNHYILGQKVTANRVGDLGTGAILRGNGDVAFDNAPSKILPVFARYYQLEIIINVNQLKS
jgi:hypothetical protein